jgi:hypothetical protein
VRSLFGGDPHFNNVVLQLPLRSHLRDESKAQRSVTVSGATTIVGDAAYFDGTGDYLQLAHSAELSPADADFCVEFECLPTTAEVDIVFCKRLTASNYGPFQVVINNYVALGYVATDGSGWAVNNCGGQTLQSGNWNHIAFVRSGTTLNLYVNGKAGTPRTVSGSLYDAETAPLFLGGNSSVSTYDFTGYIRNFRYTKGVARYTSNFTPPTSLPTRGVPILNRRVPIALSEVARPAVLRHRAAVGGDPHFDRVVALIPLRYDWNDYSKRARTITKSGTILSPARAVYFDGNSDWVLTDSHADFNPAGTWTAECWYYVVTVTSSPYILSAYSSGTIRWALQTSTSPTSGSLYVANGTGNSYALDLSNQTQTGWQHLAICRNGATSVTTVFHNGAVIYKGTPSPDFGNASHRLELGAAAFNGTNSLQGYLVDVRYTLGIERYTAKFKPAQVYGGLTQDHPIFGLPGEFITPRHGVAAPRPVFPTPLPSAAARSPVITRRAAGGDPQFNNVVLQLPLRSHLRDESKALKTVTVSGDTKIVNGAAYFDGTGDYLRMGPLGTGDSAFDFPGDFSVELWFNPSTVAPQRQMLTLLQNYSTGDWPIFQIRLEYAVLAAYFGGFSSGFTLSSGAAASVSAGSWYHVVLCRYNGLVMLFLNGCLTTYVAGRTYNFSAVTAQCPFSVGGDPVSAGYYFTGYLKDLRVTKGVARYTSNFAPPTSLPIHGVPGTKGFYPIPSTAVAAVISGVSDALGSDDVSAIAALLLTTGALSATGAVDLAAIAATVIDGAFRTGTIDASGAVDAGAFAAKIVAHGGLSASLVDDVAALVAKIIATGTLASDLSDDELVLLGKSWPAFYRATTGVVLSVPEATIGDFPPVVITDITLP